MVRILTLTIDNLVSGNQQVLLHCAFAGWDDILTIGEHLLLDCDKLIELNCCLIKL